MSQIKLVLDLLDKLMGAGNVYTPDVKAGAKEIADRCNKWDQYSKWVSVEDPKYHWAKGRASNEAPKMGDLSKAAYDLYMDKDQDNKTFVCFNKIRHTVRCEGKCDIRSEDKRLPMDGVMGRATGEPRVAYIYGHHKTNFGKSKDFTLFVTDHSGNAGALRWDKAGYSEDLVRTSKHTDVYRDKVEVFVVPGCNCEPTQMSCPTGFTTGKLGEANYNKDGDMLSAGSVYYKMPGAKSCPESEKIKTTRECYYAGRSIRRRYTKTVHQTTRPGGCFWDQNGRSYLNTNYNATASWGGVGGLCKRESRYGKKPNKSAPTLVKPKRTANLILGLPSTHEYVIKESAPYTKQQQQQQHMRMNINLCNLISASKPNR